MSRENPPRSIVAAKEVPPQELEKYVPDLITPPEVGATPSKKPEGVFEGGLGDEYAPSQSALNRITGGEQGMGEKASEIWRENKLKLSNIIGRLQQATESDRTKESGSEVPRTIRKGEGPLVLNGTYDNEAFDRSPQTGKIHLEKTFAVGSVTTPRMATAEEIAHVNSAVEKLSPEQGRTESTDVYRQVQFAKLAEKAGVSPERTTMGQSQEAYMNAFRELSSKKKPTSKEKSSVESLKKEYQQSQLAYADKLTESARKRLVEKYSEPKTDEELQREFKVRVDEAGMHGLKDAKGRPVTFEAFKQGYVKEQEKKVEKIMERYNGIVRFREVVKPGFEKEQEAKLAGLEKREKGITNVFWKAARFGAKKYTEITKGIEQGISEKVVGKSFFGHKISKQQAETIGRTGRRAAQLVAMSTLFAGIGTVSGAVGVGAAGLYLGNRLKNGLAAVGLGSLVGYGAGATYERTGGKKAAEKLKTASRGKLTSVRDLEAQSKAYKSGSAEAIAKKRTRVELGAAALVSLGYSLEKAAELSALHPQVGKVAEHAARHVAAAAGAPIEHAGQVSVTHESGAHTASPSHTHQSHETQPLHHPAESTSPAPQVTHGTETAHAPTASHDAHVTDNTALHEESSGASTGEHEPAPSTNSAEATPTPEAYSDHDLNTWQATHEQQGYAPDQEALVREQMLHDLHHDVPKAEAPTHTPVESPDHTEAPTTSPQDTPAPTDTSSSEAPTPTAEVPTPEQPPLEHGPLWDATRSAKSWDIFRAPATGSDQLEYKNNLLNLLRTSGVGPKSPELGETLEQYAARARDAIQQGTAKPVGLFETSKHVLVAQGGDEAAQFSLAREFIAAHADDPNARIYVQHFDPVKKLKMYMELTPEVLSENPQGSVQVIPDSAIKIDGTLKKVF